MKKNTVQDFENGDQVYHLSNSRKKMVVIGINEESNEVTCRWLDDAGVSHKQEFLAAEMAKIAENSGSPISILPRRNNRW